MRKKTYNNLVVDLQPLDLSRGRSCDGGEGGRRGRY